VGTAVEFGPSINVSQSVGLNRNSKNGPHLAIVEEQPAGIRIESYFRAVSRFAQACATPRSGAAPPGKVAQPPFSM